MQRDLVQGLPLEAYPHQDFAVGEVVLSHDIKTDRLPLVLAGRLHDAARRHFYGPGDLLQLVDFFASGNYRNLVIAQKPARIVWIPRQDLHDLLTKQAPMTWFLARMVAIEKRASALVGAAG